MRCVPVKNTAVFYYFLAAIFHLEFELGGNMVQMPAGSRQAFFSGFFDCLRDDLRTDAGVL
jgi:hypothetical protein